jgi:dihydroneopterin aldolase
VLVQIKKLQFKTIIGILPKERKKKQKVIVNISFEYDYKKKEFIDYSEVALFVKQNIQKHKFGLVEDAIVDTKSMLKLAFPKIKNLKLKIAKPQILKNCIVSVQN